MIQAPSSATAATAPSAVAAPQLPIPVPDSLVRDQACLLYSLASTMPDTTTAWGTTLPDAAGRARQQLAAINAQDTVASLHSP
jgi:hypothetical protein